jgi:general secretion pathway protein A
MYKEYFSLEEMPFSIAPDPRYLYMSGKHREALAHLLYGFNSDGGFVLLTGDVGTGKTTICRCLLEQIPEKTAIAFIVNPKLTVEELLAVICDEFGIRYPADNKSIKIFIDNINSYLLEAHAKDHRAVLIIDEAQNLGAAVLEQLRLLTNLETNQVKLLQIILMGQPELRDKLSQPELLQLSQRIIARYHLGALTKKEVSAYVAHRLTIAGVRDPLFSDSAIDKLYKLSGGVPRLINVLCDRALLGVFAHGKKQVTRSIIKKAAAEVFGAERFITQYKKTAVWVLIIMVTIVGVVLAASYYSRNGPPKPQPVANITKPLIFDKLEWAEDQPIGQSSKMAFESLLSQWGIAQQPQDSSSPCELAKTHGLYCLDDIGSLNILRHLNIPAVLKLSNDGNDIFYATLIALRKETAVVQLGANAKEVLLKDLESHWLGDYTVLWQKPTDYKDEVLPGYKGAMVKWLNKQLSAMRGHPIQPAENSLYNYELVKEVKRFQLTEGLKPDGIIGPKTIILLNNVIEKNTPLLNKNEQLTMSNE